MIKRLAIWTLVLAAWILVSRNNHPSPALNVLSCGTLVAASLAAVIIEREAVRARMGGVRYLTAVIALVLGLGTVAALLIHLYYDALWGPDPRRFGLLSNLVMDTGFVGVHFLLARAWERLAGIRP